MVELLLVPLLEQQDMSSQFLYAAPDLGEHAFIATSIRSPALLDKLTYRKLISQCVCTGTEPARVH